MASAVATPLEKQFTTIAGLDAMTSTSTQGSSSISLQFALDRDIDAAAQDVQAAIAQTLRSLPKDITAPSYQKVNPADDPILYLALTSKTLPLSTLSEYGENLMAQRISMVQGVAQVQVFGSQKYAVRARVDPRVLASRSVGIDEVAAAIQKGNVNLPTGTIWGRFQAYTIQTAGQLTSAEAYRPLVVTYRNGAPIRLGELGQVVDSVENDKVASWYNDRPAIVLAIQRQPGTNTVEVVKSILDLLPVFRAQIPASVDLNVLYDRSVSIKESVRDVQLTLLLAMALVVLVIFLFLRNLSATIIPSLALPMCIVGSFSVMYLLDYSLDNLSLMALILSVGFVVNDAIVMLENIVRHVEAGETPWQAALRGSREIGFTILSMTLSLAAVFIPVLFMGGVVGRLLHEFAATIIAAILISGVVSLTLTPMLCSRFLRPPAAERHGRLYAASERVFNAMLAGYDWSLTRVLRRPRTTILVSFVLFAATAFLFVYMPKGFLPNEDTGLIFTFTEAAQGVSWEIPTVLVEDSDHQPLGWGAYSPKSQIAIRMWTFDVEERVVRILGVLDVQSEHMDAFSEESANIQMTLAAQVATALQNAQSLDKTRKQAELESMVNAIGQKIQRTASIEETLQTAIRELGLAIGATRVTANIVQSGQRMETPGWSQH